MAEIITTEDITQLFSGCTIMYKKEPVYVREVESRNKIHIQYLKDSKKITVPFSFDDFKPVSSRLGFINISNGVIYLTRRPIRRFQVGLCNTNVSMHWPLSNIGVHNHVLVDKLHRLNTVEVFNCIEGKYPTFKQCCARVKKAPAIMAFDKQFAIDSNGDVFYRSKRVGKFNLEQHKEIEDIVFNKGAEHLILLLKGNHEKGCGDFKPA